MSPKASAPSSPASTRKTDPKTLETLVCPVTKTRLVFNAGDGELVSVAARLAYPIRQGIPLLVLDEARQLSEDELAHLAR